MEVEQDFFLVFGHAFNRIDEELRAKKPRLRELFNVAVRIFTTRKQRDRLRQRLTERTRTAEAFVKFNRYLMVKLAVKS